MNGGSTLISEPYQTDDGKWWVKSDVSGEVHNFATSEEAYHFYHRILKLQGRLDTAPPTEFKPSPPEPAREPLLSVPETRPASLDTPPAMTDAEKKEVYDNLTEGEIARLDYEKAKKGEMPLTYFFRKWVGPAIVGLAALAMLYFKKCG